MIMLSSPVRPFQGAPFRWLLKAIALGALPTALIVWIVWPGGLLPVIINALIGAFCAVIIWGGYELASPWLMDHPRRLPPDRAALLSLGKWIVLYVGLVALCLSLGNLVFRINLLNPFTVLFTGLIGLLLSSLVVSVRTTSSLVATARDLEQARGQANLIALKAQLSPHTLFNALNTIAALIPEDPTGAERAVEHLSSLLRRILQALELESWTLQEEFQLVRDLLELERIRFGDRLEVDLDLSPSLASRPIPPLMLLPLAENALKHGFRPKVGACHLSLRAAGCCVTVADDGVGRDPGAPEGVGLRTVRERLEAMGGGLRWPVTDRGCIVEVSLP
ncbi:MAG: histidine kinase [Geothrix sp.]|nr:histidine kinase [Geothrix sp.]